MCKKTMIYEFIWYENPEIIKDNPGWVDEENESYIREITAQLDREGYVISDTRCVNRGKINLKRKHDKPPERVESFKIKFYGHKKKQMDVVEEHVFKKVHAFVGQKFGYLEPGRTEPHISLNQREAYIVLKLFDYRAVPKNIPLQTPKSINEPMIKPPVN